MKYLITLIIIFFSSICYANSYLDSNELSIGYAPWCYHFNRPSDDEDINENPNAVMISLNKWTFLTFENSNFDRSYFLGKEFQLKEWKYKNYFTKLNIYGGILHGYEIDFNVGGWVPVVVPTIEIGKEKISLETMLNPFAGGITSLMIKYKF